MIRPPDMKKLGVVLSHWGQNILPVAAAFLTFLQLALGCGSGSGCRSGSGGKSDNAGPESCEKKPKF